MPIDKSPLVIKEFKGKLVTDADLWHTALGEQDQVKVPFDYALESVNLTFLKKGGMRTRDGIEKYVKLEGVNGKPVQMWKINYMNKFTYTDRWLILTWDGASGRLYDTQSTLGNPIFTLANMKYAFVINVFGKAYISPWTSWANPINGGLLYVYNGAYVPRAAGCIYPTVGAPAFAVGVAAGGNCTPGLHMCTVIFETDSGCRSGPIPTQIAAPLTATTTAGNATITFSNIPVAPAGNGVVARHLLVTKLVVNNNGQGLNAYEPFIAVTINDNTTTGPISFTRPDSSLLESAKAYLFNSTLGGTYLPACISLAAYQNRLVLISPRLPGLVELIVPPDPLASPRACILVSPPNNPEQIIPEYNNIMRAEYITNDAIYIAPSFSGLPMAGAEINGILYVFKEDATFAVVGETDKSPSEWKDPELVDSAKGAFPFGIANVGNNPTSNTEGSLIVCGAQGISYFNGRFSQRSLAEAIWDEYKIADLKWAKVLVEPIRQLIFLRIGDPNSDNLQTPHGANRGVFVANYYYGVDVTSIRWGEWRYLIDHTGTPLLSVVDIDLRAPGTAGNEGPAGIWDSTYSFLTILYRIGTSEIRIYSEAIIDRDFLITLGVNAKFPNWLHETGFTSNNSGELYTHGPVMLRILRDNGGALGVATPNVLVEKCGIDSNTWVTIGTFDPLVNPRKYFSLNANFVGEQMRLRLSGENRILIDALILYRTESAKDRPRI